MSFCRRPSFAVCFSSTRRLRSSICSSLSAANWRIFSSSARSCAARSSRRRFCSSLARTSSRLRSACSSLRFFSASISSSTASCARDLMSWPSRTPSSRRATLRALMSASCCSCASLSSTARCSAASSFRTSSSLARRRSSACITSQRASMAFCAALRCALSCSCCSRSSRTEARKSLELNVLILSFCSYSWRLALRIAACFFASCSSVSCWSITLRRSSSSSKRCLRCRSFFMRCASIVFGQLATRALDTSLRCARRSAASRATCWSFCSTMSRRRAISLSLITAMLGASTPATAAFAAALGRVRLRARSGIATCFVWVGGIRSCGPRGYQVATRFVYNWVPSISCRERMWIEA
mmetsp:Transcript_26040/g.80455  ORF Transcript_26040/g.80455 Transcript_26040/m.80455 type:complete len:355 (-) Transcript_26040:42-1106(-)